MTMVLTSFPAALCPPSADQNPGMIDDHRGPQTPGTNTASSLTYRVYRIESFIHSHTGLSVRVYPGFIQARLCKIQGLFKDFSKTFLLFSRTDS